MVNHIQQIFHKLPMRLVKIVTSNSKAITLVNYQPGGMATLSISKWTSCTRIADQDQSGLGCWSYIEFEGHDG